MSPKKKVEILIDAVCDKYGVDRDDLMDGTQMDLEIRLPRFVLMSLIHDKTDFSRRYIAELFGYTSPSPVQTALRDIEGRVFTEGVNFTRTYTELLNQVI